MIETAPAEVIAGADDGIRVVGLGLHGYRQEALAALGRMKSLPRVPLLKNWTDHLGAWLERRVPEMIDSIAMLSALAIFEDPEALFQEGWMLCDVGEHELGLSYLERGVGSGYLASPVLQRAPQFDALRGTPAFESLMVDAEGGRLRALEAFRNAGGETLLGRREPR
jgi:hypothetical protein